MKIIKLTSRNIKNLKAIEITPAGDVFLTGKNGAGKSAVIDSIYSTLTGNRLKDPIRHGEDRADVVVDMGDFTVKKVWTEKGETIQVYTLNEEGKKIQYTSPQTFLNEKIGDLSFDPMAFKDMKPMGQIELLKKIAGLDFSEIEKDKATVYEERSGLNSRIKESLAHLQNTEAPDPSTPNEEIAYKGELDKIQVLRDKRQAFLSAKEEKEGVGNSLLEAHAAIDEKKACIEALQAEIVGLEQSCVDYEGVLKGIAMPDEISVEQIIASESALEDIEKKNADIRAAKRYRQSIKDAEKLKKEADTLTERLRRLDQDKATQVANATFPIPDLSLTDVAVMYKGDQFDRLSTGQQIRVSTSIGMALNPELKVIFIREGALLDSDNLKEIVEQAKDSDFQIWIEKTLDNSGVGFYISDGSITHIDGKPTEGSDEKKETTEQE